MWSLGCETERWTRRSALRSVDERPSMADRCSASPSLWTSACGQGSAVGLDATIDRHSIARSGLLLNGFELETWLVHGCRR
ncbi:hypothetical protein ACJRO7_023966 [Eucalyptus globulus]|uniref:Uncharacterized protein n=1 Tax=Eucalyptus globulus TaxID=34317 RepID=A0ABD3K3X1_EUCGL